MINPGDVLIFDLDGTLVQSVEFDEALFKEAIAEVTGHSDFNSNWESYTHVTDVGLVGEILSDLDVEDAHRKIEVVREVFCQKVGAYLKSNSDCEPIPGAREALGTLMASGMKFGIATGGWGDSARMKLRHAGLQEPAILSSSDDGVSRVAIMKDCLRRLGAEHNQAVYFGDAPWDAKATAELGWRFVGVGSRVVHMCDAWISDFSDPSWVAALHVVAEP